MGPAALPRLVVRAQRIPQRAVLLHAGNLVGGGGGVLIAPLMPGINDGPEQVQELLQAAVDAGATGIGGVALHLRGDVRRIFMAWLRCHRPDLVPLYNKLYARSASVPPEERKRIPYTPTFIEQVRGGNVKEISSRGETLQGDFRRKYKGAEHFKTDEEGRKVSVGVSFGQVSQLSARSAASDSSSQNRWCENLRTPCRRSDQKIASTSRRTASTCWSAA